MTGIFLFLFFRKYVYMRHPASGEGRIAIVTTREAGMRWTRRRARRARSERTAKTCGSGAATLALSSRRLAIRPRGRNADIARVTGTTKPAPREEHGISVNTIARGMP